ncbi:hypothetical protein GQ42DRAFT_158578 [Ramicandelaber brevisporus]|nr:hypothetical protein GQ42DRAFT_158578 [Ramicandelaber brevisporus]
MTGNSLVVDLTSGHALLVYTAAFVAYLFYKVYLFARVPSQLRHIPRMPIWSYFEEVYHGYNWEEAYNRLRSQLITADSDSEKPSVEAFLRRGRSGWVVHLANAGAS